MTAAEIDAVAVTARPGLAGPLHGRAWPPPRRTRSGWACRSTACTISPPTSPSTPSHPARCPQECVALLVSGGHSSLLARRGSGASGDRGAGRDRRRRGGGGLRQGGPPARHGLSRGVRRSTGRPPTGRVSIDFPRGKAADGTPRFLLQRLEDGRGALDRKPGSAAASRCRSPTWRRASRKPSPTSSPRRRSAPAAPAGLDTLVIGGGVAANSRLRALAAERAERAGLRLRIPRRAPVHGQRRDGRRARLACGRGRRAAERAGPRRQLQPAGGSRSSALPMSWVMWEAKAAPGQTDALLAWLLDTRRLRGPGLPQRRSGRADRRAAGCSPRLSRPQTLVSPARRTPGSSTASADGVRPVRLTTSVTGA